MSEKKFNLSEWMKKVDWERTNRLCLDDGKEYGGAVWLYLHRDVKEFIEKLKDLFDETRKDKRFDKLFKDIDKLAGDKFKTKKSEVKG